MILLAALATLAAASPVESPVRDVSQAVQLVQARPLTLTDGVVSLPASDLPGLVLQVDERLQAFAARAAETHGAAAPVEGAGPADSMRALRVVSALSQELAGFDAQAIRGLSGDDVEALSRRAFDRAAGSPAPAPEAEPLRYGKLHVALEYYLRGKGYTRTLEAMNFAREKHTHKRKDGLTPEFQHQVEIALFLTTLKDVKNEELALTAAMLHDVVEDYDVSREEIARRFGADVEDVVWRLTKAYKGEHKAYPDYFAAIAEDPTASLVKGADRVNNLQTMVGVFSPAKQREYAQEAERWFLPMLKTARRRFPSQAAAYLNVEHMIKSQLQLIRASLAQAERAQPPVSPLKAVERDFAARAPMARLELDVERRYVYANRERISDAEGFFAELLTRLREAASDSGVAVLDTTFALPGEDLFRRNLIDEPALARAVMELGPDGSYESMTEEQRSRLLFEPFARALDARPGPVLFHVDHHYAPRLLASASTTPLVVDFLRHLQETGRYSLIQRLQRAYALLDHSDTDILLAHLALRQAHDPSFLAAHGDLLRDAALFNDYVRESGRDEDARARAKILYNVAGAVEGRVASGAMKYSEAFPLLEQAARWTMKLPVPRDADVETRLDEAFAAAPGDSPMERALRALFREGFADYKRELVILRRMTASGVAQGPASAIAPDTMRRDGPALLVYVGDGEQPVSNASVVRYLQAEHPELLEGVYAVVTTGAKEGNRFFKMRSFSKEDGRYLDLADPEDGLYARLNLRVAPDGKRYAARGRHFAGGGAKGGFGPLKRERVVRVLADISAAAAEAAVRQRLR